jgi:hypothetical protein
MMKKISILIILVLISCKASHQKSDCNENMKFKEMFFYHIEYIENNIGVLQDAKFRQSVIFISNYAPVSVNSIINYARSYPIGVFEQDKIKWIDWYEENKCKNIQFKDTYIIPEVYQDDFISE